MQSCRNYKNVAFRYQLFSNDLLLLDKFDIGLARRKNNHYDVKEALATIYENLGLG